MAKTYSELITQVIRDFDEIYTILRTKGAKNSADGTALPESGDTSIATSTYANIISKYLFSVNGLDNTTITSTTIANKRNAVADATNSVAVNYGTNSIALSGLAAGYYDNTSTITVTDASLFSAVTAENFTPVTNSEGKVTGYEVVPTTSIIKSVSLNKASVTGSISLSPAADSTPTLSSQHTLTEGTGLDISDATITGGYSFTIACTPQIQGKYNASINSLDIKTGLLKSTDDVVLSSNSIDLSGITAEAASKTYYIAKSTRTLSRVEADVSIENTSGIETVSAGEGGYEISASALKPTITQSVTAGYTEADTDTLTTEDENYTLGSNSIYIKRGEVKLPTGTAAPKNGITTSGVGTLADAADGNKVSIEVNASVAGFEMVTTQGYVKEEDVQAIPTISSKKYINIDKATATVSVGENNVITSTSDALAASGKAIVVKTTPTLTKSITAGYLSSDTEVTATSKEYSSTLYIKEGSIGALTNSFSVTAHDDGNTPTLPEGTASELFKQLFLDSAPASGDYYELTANASITATTGYVTGGTFDKSAGTYYIPRATVEYVEDSTGTNFIQVKTAGFLPSGTITPIEGEIDLAAVSVSATSENGLILDATGNDIYNIVLSKGSVSAGYISGTQGTVSGSISLAHATASTTASITGVEKGEITASGNEYIVNLTATGTAKTVVTEGYIKTTDVKFGGNAVGNGDDNAISLATSISLDKATVALKSADVTGDVAATGLTFLPVGETSAYSVAPTLGSGTGSSADLTITATKAGYIAKDDETKATVALSNVTNRYIKAGTPLTNVNGAGSAKIKTNLGEIVEGSYTISLDGTNTFAVSGKLAEGYYASTNETAVSGTATVNALTGTTTIAHGKVAINGVSTALSVESDKVNIITNPENANNYYQISAVASGLTVTRDVTTGYVKTGDISVTANAIDNTNSGAAYYIGRYATESYMAADGSQGSADNEAHAYLALSGFGITGSGDAATAQDFAIIPAADKYSERDIGVKLHADAAGSSVRSALSDLEARLAGDNVSVVSVI